MSHATFNHDTIRLVDETLKKKQDEQYGQDEQDKQDKQDEPNEQDELKFPSDDELIRCLLVNRYNGTEVEAIFTTYHKAAVYMVRQGVNWCIDMYRDSLKNITECICDKPKETNECQCGITDHVESFSNWVTCNNRDFCEIIPVQYLNANESFYVHMGSESFEKDQMYVEIIWGTGANRCTMCYAQLDPPLQKLSLESM